MEINNTLLEEQKENTELLKLIEKYFSKIAWDKNLYDHRTKKLLSLSYQFIGCVKQYNEIIEQVLTTSTILTKTQLRNIRAYFVNMELNLKDLDNIADYVCDVSDISKEIADIEKSYEA